MKKSLIIFAIITFQISEMFAGPGGKIAVEFFSTPLGKGLALLLCIIFLPWIIISYFKKTKAIRETKAKMNQLTKINFELFDEINLKNRMTDVFTRVHLAWSDKDLENCEEYMTPWYRQNQQTVYLDEWNKKGFMNVCSIEEVKSVDPIHLRLADNENFNGTRIIYSITAHMEDYLISIEDSSMVEGEKGFKDVKTAWTLKLENGVWKVDNIEQGATISSYMKMDSELTDSILEKHLSKSRA